MSLPAIVDMAALVGIEKTNVKICRAASRATVLFVGLTGAVKVVAIACNVIEAANSKAYEKAKVNYFLHASILYQFWSRGART